MGAQYQLEQKALWWSALGLSIAGCLIFLAGMLVGISLGGTGLMAEGEVPATAPTVVPQTPPLEGAVLAAQQPQGEPPVVQVPPRDGSPQDLSPQDLSPQDLSPDDAPPPEQSLGEPSGPEATPEDLLDEMLAEGSVVNEPVVDDPVLSPFSLQVGAYLVQENLERALADLEKKGLEARVVEITDSRGTVLSSVRIGEYGKRSEAESAAAQLRRKNGLEVLVKRELQQG